MNELNSEITEFINKYLYKSPSLYPENYGINDDNGTPTERIYGKIIIDVPELNYKIYEAMKYMYLYNGDICWGYGINYRYRLEYMGNDWKERLNGFINEVKERFEFRNELDRFVSNLLDNNIRIERHWNSIDILSISIYLTRIGIDKWIHYTFDTLEVPECLKIITDDIDSVKDGNYNVSKYATLHDVI